MLWLAGFIALWALAFVLDTVSNWLGDGKRWMLYLFLVIVATNILFGH